MTLKSFFIYLFIMAVSTYLIRVIPFVLVKHQIKNRFISRINYCRFPGGLAFGKSTHYGKRKEG